MHYARFQKSQTPSATLVNPNPSPMKTYYSGKEITSLFIVLLFILLMVYSWLQ